jgi:DNA polymerase-3 subunit delta'
MNNLVIHPLTKGRIEEFIKNPSHAVMLVGPTGIGKGALARDLATAVLKMDQDDLDDYPYKLLIQPDDKKTIGIAVVRELEHFLSLKVPRGQAINRVVIIEGAHNLTIEAQNALLKTLEEPPPDSLLILAADHEKALLPTIQSRLQFISVRRPEKADIKAHFKDLDPRAVEQAYAISGGLPGLMQALLMHDDHPLLTATEHARRLLSQTTYDRLLAVDELAKQRELALGISLILQQMAHLSLQTAAGAAANRWQRVLRASYSASEALGGNASAKLVLTNLMLSL